MPKENEQYQNGKQGGMFPRGQPAWGGSSDGVTNSTTFLQAYRHKLITGTAGTSPANEREARTTAS
jgi:hypothetical protein